MGGCKSEFSVTVGYEGGLIVAKKNPNDAKWKNDYARRNYDRMLLVLPLGAKEQLKELSAEQGVSVNRYILEAVEQRSGLKLTLDNGLPWVMPNDGEK